jgi:hypothetical protein
LREVSDNLGYSSHGVGKGWRDGSPAANFESKNFRLLLFAVGVGRGEQRKLYYPNLKEKKNVVSHW